MNIREIMELQSEFDSKHTSKFNWNEKISDNNLEMLEFLLISLTGEIGETCNLIKKVVRGDFTLIDKKEEISEEIADIFIYLIKICNQLDVNLEQSYLDKLEKNKQRFKRYEND